MRALSLKQPFAELVISGKKTIELRKWNTKYRGEFLVHASKQPDKEAMKKIGYTELPLGAIIGRAEIISVKKYENEAEFEEDKDKHLTTKGNGKYGFILRNAKRTKPTPAKGKLGFWKYK